MSVQLFILLMAFPFPCLMQKHLFLSLPLGEGVGGRRVTVGCVADSASTVLSSWGVTCSFELADRGALHKAISLENNVHIIEETQLFQDFEPVQTLLLSSKKVK